MQKRLHHQTIKEGQALQLLLIEHPRSNLHHLLICKAQQMLLGVIIEKYFWQLLSS
jgi:hypothetical protein